MLGPPKLRSMDRPITVTLESLLPANHFYRHLDAKLDLSFVREWVEELYKPGGRPSIDLKIVPVVFWLSLLAASRGLGGRSRRRNLHAAHTGAPDCLLH